LEIKPGTIVCRKSHARDILFKICAIEDNKAMLKGMDVRLMADAPLDDLEIPDAIEVLQHRHKSIEENMRLMRRIFREREKGRNNRLQRAMDSDNTFEVPGQVLHLDGDPEYLEKCLNSYAQLDMEVHGFVVEEREQPSKAPEYFRRYRPDIIILTGHDALLKNAKDFRDLNNYRHSRYFVEAVKNLRNMEPDKDNLVIFAGACQSHYEAILAAGANFASSPQRVLIHAYDPVFVAEKIAYTSIYGTLAIDDVVSGTITGVNGIGGVETRGKLRLGYPKSPY